MACRFFLFRSETTKQSSDCRAAAVALDCFPPDLIRGSLAMTLTSLASLRPARGGRMRNDFHRGGGRSRPSSRRDRIAGRRNVKPLPLNDETRVLAQRLVWFEPPEKALADPVRFLAYAFARATHEELKALRAYVDDANLREALDHAPPGVIDPRSWAYWNLRLGRYPAPPMPRRRLA